MAKCYLTKVILLQIQCGMTSTDNTLASLGIFQLRTNLFAWNFRIHVYVQLQSESFYSVQINTFYGHIGRETCLILFVIANEIKKK